MKKDMPNPLVCHGHSRPIVDVQYSQITNDGYFIASASKDGQPMIRNGETGDWIGTFLGHKGAVWVCVLNKPALLAATASADYTARLWDALTGDELHKFEQSCVVRTVAFAQQSNKTITGGMDRKLRVYDLQRPEAPPQVSGEGEDKLRSAQFTQGDSSLLVTYMDKPGIHVWDARTLTHVRTVESSGPVTSVEVAFDDQYVTTADGKFIKVWEGSSLREHKSMETPYQVESASYCPVVNRLAAGGEDMWVHLYHGDTYEELDVNKGHHGPVHCVRFAPTNDAYASGSEDGTIRIWQVKGGSENGGANGTEEAAANGPSA